MRIQVGDSFTVPKKAYNQAIPILEIMELAAQPDSQEEAGDYGWGGLVGVSAFCSTSASNLVEKVSPAFLLVPPDATITVTVTGYQPKVDEGIKIHVIKQIEKRPAVAFTCYMVRSYLEALLAAE